MPEMDGFEATRQIRQDHLLNNTVVIAISASAFEHTRHQSLAAGCDDFLVKPVQIDQLLARLQEHMKLEWVHRHTIDKDHEVRDLPGESGFTDSQPSSGQQIFPPPEEDLIALFELIKRGDIMALSPHLDHIEQLDQKYLPFVSRLRQLAHNFQLNELEALISGYLEPQT
jgi:hypothetical protein